MTISCDMDCDLNGDLLSGCDDFQQQLRAHPLNQLDYIPLISCITGIARAIFGAFQLVLGVVIMPIQMIREWSKEKQEQLTLINGLANIVRGYVAAHPVVGNIALYLYDRTIVSHLS